MLEGDGGGVDMVLYEREIEEGLVGEIMKEIGGAIVELKRGKAAGVCG